MNSGLSFARGVKAPPFFLLGCSVAIHFSPILLLISMGIAAFVMPSLVWNFSGLVLKVTRLHLNVMITMLGSPGHLHLNTESFRLSCSSKFAGELAEVFFNYFFFPLKTKQVVVVYNIGICLF